jgi:hypothetical protein
MRTGMRVIRLNGYNLHRAAEIIGKAQIRDSVWPLGLSVVFRDSWLADRRLLAVHIYRALSRCMRLVNRRWEECIDFQEALYIGSVTPLGKI